jgi:hypothetical protein
MNTTYLDLSIAINDKACPDGERPCGKLDTLGNVLCMKKEKTCPMNYVKVLPGNSTIPKDMNYTVIEAEDMVFLFANENTQGRIVNQFTLSEAQPCMNPRYHNRTVTPYKLDMYYDDHTCEKSLGGMKLDSGFQKLDTTTTKRVLMENGIFNILSILPDYPTKNLDNPISLYYKNYYGMNPSCLKPIRDAENTDELINDLLTRKEQMSSVSTLAVWAMILGIIYCVFSIILNIIFAFTLKYESSVGSVPRAIFNSAIVGLLIIATFAITCVINSRLKNHDQFYSTINDPNCVDAPTHEAVNAYIAGLKSAKKYCIIDIILMALTMLLTITNAFYSIFKS